MAIRSQHSWTLAHRESSIAQRPGNLKLPPEGIGKMLPRAIFSRVFSQQSSPGELDYRPEGESDGGTPHHTAATAGSRCIGAGTRARPR
jgi:hypothetical protein